MFFSCWLTLFKNQLTKAQKKIFVDPDPLSGFVGPKVFFLIFCLFEWIFFLIVFNIETNDSINQIKNKSNRKLIKNFLKLIWKWTILTKIVHFQQGVLLQPNVQKWMLIAFIKAFWISYSFTIIYVKRLTYRVPKAFQCRIY